MAISLEAAAEWQQRASLVSDFYLESKRATEQPFGRQPQQRFQRSSINKGGDVHGVRTYATMAESDEAFFTSGPAHGAVGDVFVPSQHLSHSCPRHAIGYKSDGHAREYSVLVNGLLPNTKVQDLREALERACMAMPSDIYLPSSREDIGFIRYRDSNEAKRLVEFEGIIFVQGAAVTFALADDSRRLGSAPNQRSRQSARQGQVQQQEQGRTEEPREKEGPAASFEEQLDRVQLNTMPMKTHSLRLTNVPHNTNRTHLMSALSQAGVEHVVDLYIPNGKTYGFVRFDEMQAAEAAYHFLRGGFEFNGKRLGVEMSNSHPKGHRGQLAVDEHPESAVVNARQTAEFMEGATAASGCLIAQSSDVQEARTAAEALQPQSQREMELERKVAELQRILASVTLELQHTRAQLQSTLTQSVDTSGQPSLVLQRQQPSIVLQPHQAAEMQGCGFEPAQTQLGQLQLVPILRAPGQPALYGQPLVSAPSNQRSSSSALVQATVHQSVQAQAFMTQVSIAVPNQWPQHWSSEASETAEALQAGSQQHYHHNGAHRTCSACKSTCEIGRLTGNSCGIKTSAPSCPLTV
eukprot:TRINITY_DN29408_c0_g1_i1.p1 TRINITY_DN29408_c0_g1~~TRINITY_DN29408_c0_g1_i1.p1  ORF type:complete len:580 (+),score=91.69 TRINITY_DN29408_c0_g1_i1:90-1829(+)